MDDRYLDHNYELAGRNIDPVAGTVRWQGEVGALSRKQLEVLAVLAGADGQPVSREQLIELVWDGNKPVGERGLTNTVYEIRRSLEDKGSKEPLIRTIPRRGYQLLAAAHLVLDDGAASFAAGWRVPGKADWRLEHQLSRNAYAETWLAKQEGSPRRRWLRFCRSEEHLRRLRREVTVLRFLREKLEGEGSIAGIADWQLEEPPYFLEMEAAAHGSLVDWTASRGGLDRIPLGERIRIICHAAQALATVHGLGVVHRNISPTSILVDEEQGQVCGKLGEFALGDLTERADLAQAGITATSLTFSSGGLDQATAYLAPECRTGLAPDSAGDVYALGVVLYRAVAGDWHRDLHRDLEADWRESFPSSKLRDIVSACVADRAVDRPSAQDLSRQLQDFQTSPPEPEAPPETKLEQAPSRAAEIKAMRAAVGQSVGPYRLLEVLGEGGMGTVYLAEQRRPVERKVALKLIKAGMDGEQVLARFEAERQALALMDHDNVAAVFDAGTTESGHPYFVMEYVPGLDVTEHCDRAKLKLRGRIELFLQVCDGVQHAHQKGLIHRDLKPSNILVKKLAGEPASVKIIDFGVAKSLQKKLSDHTVHTRFGTFVGTPRYSSPEQVSSQWPDVDTRSDVYSLGVVLYELVTGVTPHSSDELAGRSSAEIAKILEAEPPTPRSRFTRLEPTQKEEIARNRSRSVAELEQRLHADLSWILLKSLEPDPEDRYASIVELRRDLSRWLCNEPIEARPTTQLYRLGKLVRRHRTAFAATVLGTLTLLATTTFAVVGFLRAEEEAAKARRAALEAEKAAKFQVRQLRSIDPASMAAGLRKALREQIGEQRRQRGSTTPEEDQRQHDLLIQGVNFTDLLLAQLDANFFEPALREIETGYEEFPLLQTRLWQATADTLGQWDHLDQAVEPQELALDLRRSLLGAEDPLTLASLHRRGVLRRELGQLDEASADLQSATRGLMRSLGSEDPKTLAAINDLGLLQLARSELDEAESSFREALAGRRLVLGAHHPDTLRSLHGLAQLLMNQSKYAEAEALYREALAGRRQVFGEDHVDTLKSVEAIATVLHYQHRFDEAETYYRQALAGFRRLLGRTHQTTLIAVQNLSALLVAKGQLDEAQVLHQEVLEARRRIYGDDHPRTLSSIAGFAFFLYRKGQIDEAETYFREALRGSRRVLGNEHQNTLVVINNLATLLRNRGELEEAEALARELLEGFQKNFGPEHRNTLRSLHSLALVLHKQGQFEQGMALFRQALEVQRRTLGDQHRDTIRTIRASGDLLREWGKLDLAEAHYREAIEGQKLHFGENGKETLRTMRLLAKVLRQKGQENEATELDLEIESLESTGSASSDPPTGR